MTDPKVMTIECTECKKPTNHEVVGQFDTNEYIEEARAEFWESYRIVRCKGCDTCSFAHLARNSVDLNPAGEPDETRDLYPSRKKRSPRSKYYYFPGTVRRLYLETLTALSNDALTLAAAGIRAVVEATCLDQGIKQGNLEGKIDALVSEGVLTRDQANLLHLQRYLGNLAVHELQRPEEGELEAALEIVEILLTTLYILPKTAAKMKRSQAEAAKKQKTKPQSGPAKP